MKDEDIQERINQGESVPGHDGQVYRKIVDALQREPKFSLPPSFADRVTLRIQARSSSASSDLVWLYMGITACVLALAVAIWRTGFTPELGILKFLTGYPALTLFGVVFIAGLQWLDRRLVKKSI